MRSILDKTLIYSSILGLVISVFVTQPAFAVAAEDMQVLLSDSRPSTVANWTITYDQNNTSGQLQAADTLVLTIPTGFSLGSVDETDIDFKVGSTDETLQNAACGATDTIRYTVSGQVMTFDPCDSYTAEAAGSVIEIEIGLNATFGVAGNAQITNHATPAVYTVTVDTSDEDAKDALIAVTSGVDLSATVDETLTFTVGGRTTAECNTLVTGGTENNNSTATTLPFGTISSDTFYNECQRLTVGTNAAGGYSTTVQTTTLPTSGANTIAKGSCDTSPACSITVSEPWSTATNNGYAYCMKDQTGDGAATADATDWATAEQCAGGSQAFKLVARANASETPEPVMASAGATTTNDVSDIGFRMSIGSGQAAGTYNTVVIYIATPTF